MKRKDYITLLSMLFLIALCYAITRTNNNAKGQYVKVIKNNNLIGTYSLSENRTVDLGNNILIIKNGSVVMEDAICPDKLCQKQAPISNTGEQIVCLPNKVVASITSANSPISRDNLFFNTYINITIYDSENEAILDEAMQICQKYENICSRTNASSELYKLNHRLIIPLDIKSEYPHYPVSDELYNMIRVGLEYGKKSHNIFNIAIAPITDLWDFSSQKPILPDEDKLSKMLPYCNPSDIILNDDSTISFKSENTMIDLGGIAKGYIADEIKKYLLSKNVNSATISLGGNILCVGNKYGQPFNIGITKPFDQNRSIIKDVDIINKSVVTSGSYERYFKIDDTIYHHILDSKTGYPVNSDIISITIISDKSVDGDCLSTWLFSIGKDEALKYATNHPEIQLIIVDTNNKIVTANF